MPCADLLLHSHNVSAKVGGMKVFLKGCGINAPFSPPPYLPFEINSIVWVFGMHASL